MTDLLQPLRNFLIALRFVIRGNKWYYGWLALLSVLIISGIFSYIKLIDQGLIVTNMRDQVSWGFYISNFTFLVGVAAAAVLLVIPAYLYNFKPIKETRHTCSSARLMPTRPWSIRKWCASKRPDSISSTTMVSAPDQNSPTSLPATLKAALRFYTLLHPAPTPPSTVGGR